VDAQLRRIDPSDESNLQYCRKEKEQPRKEKEQLRKEKEQLRDKDLHSAGSLASIPAFLELLRKGGIQRPEEKVIAKIRASFAYQLLANIHSVDSAVEFYYQIKDLPSTLTMCIVQEHASVRISGPLNSEKPKILAGVRENGESIVVKLLFIGTDDARPLKERKSDIEHEVVCCTALAMADRSIALVPHEVVKINAPQEFAGQTQNRGEFQALLMPRYFGSIASGPSFSEAVIAREARRLLDALQYMHLEAGLVHMDVKLDNVFFDNSGWFLGDFGSSCKIGEPIRTTTATFYHGAMAVGAHPRYDWFMLLVLVLIELGDKDQWSSRFMDTGRGRVSYEKVMSETERILSDATFLPDLRAVVSDIKAMYTSMESP
jgi:serine/threonine protein kinase